MSRKRLSGCHQHWPCPHLVTVTTRSERASKVSSRLSSTITVRWHYFAMMAYGAGELPHIAIKIKLALVIRRQ
jgi:hypothetical protein